MICNFYRSVRYFGGSCTPDFFQCAEAAQGLNRACAMWRRWEICSWIRRWARSPTAGRSISLKSKLYSAVAWRTKIRNSARTSPTSSLARRNRTEVFYTVSRIKVGHFYFCDNSKKYENWSTFADVIVKIKLAWDTWHNPWRFSSPRFFRATL